MDPQQTGEWLAVLSEFAIQFLDAIALVVIVGGSVQAVTAAMRLLPHALDGHARRLVWLRYARWLVAGLTFQLAADIIATSITSDWAAIARVAAIALIRTFLNH